MIARHRSVRACSTTTRSPTRPISCREQIVELAAELPNLHAVKESSADLRRVMAIRALSRRASQILRRCRRRHRRERSMPAPSAGSRDSSTPSPPNRWRCYGHAMRRTKGGGVRALPVVPAAAAHGHGGQVRAADQARCSSASAWEATVCGRHDCRCKARSCAKRHSVIDRALATRPRLAAAMETNVSDKAAIA